MLLSARLIPPPLRTARRLPLLAALACALPLLAGEAHAQRVERGARPGAFDFYVLALSWSPGFCELEGRADRRDQCAVGRKHGFVVHGLWPQYERGYPRECAAMPRVPSRQAMNVAAGIFPEQGLARHQWRVHGTCSGQTPEAYFRDTARARDRVTIPPALHGLPGDRVASPAEVERAFIAANPGLQPDMIATACQRGRLKEVRICLSRDLSGFRVCPEVDRSGCRDRNVTIDAPE
ncbi:ribonuclease T [Pseudochelatococcus lubricantis]|uniref:ribonuclease T2 family protein n=1 Tax=Pseudochelatococcus lubricantis TaxID=1538102 RepID=UPI0035E73FE7